MIIKLKLDRDYDRPTIQIKTTEDYMDCLIDTGAIIPVWTLGETVFQRHFKNNFRKTDKYTIIGGFGRGVNLGKIYEIEKFVLQDTWNGNKLVIHNLPVAVVDRADMAYKFILSATMFNRSRTTFDYMTNQPYIRIEATRDLYARYKLSTNNNLQMKIKLADTRMQRKIKEAYQNANIVDSIYSRYRAKIVVYLYKKSSG